MDKMTSPKEMEDSHIINKMKKISSYRAVNDTWVRVWNSLYKEAQERNLDISGIRAPSTKLRGYDSFMSSWARESNPYGC